MDLRTKYAQAVELAKSFRMEGSAQEREGKLHFVGTVKSEDEKNRIWNALRTVPDWKTDIMADIRVVAPAAPPSAAAPRAARTYTVQAGDTLSNIAKAQLGNAGEHTRIFDANRDQLKDPDKIAPGQVLRIPA